MDTFKSLLSPFTGASNPLQDTLKLVVVGGTIETARRVSVSAWNGFIDSFFLTAHFSQEDYPYDWLMHWLSKQPAWGRSREFDITTRSVSRSGITQSTTGDLEDEEGDDDEVMLSGRKKRRVAIVPSLDTTHTIYYKGHWLRITRTKRFQDYGSYAEIKICVVARNNDILKKLVLEAKREYEKDAVHRVHIYMADTTYGGWRWNGARQKRPMSSIVLEPGVKDMILADCQDFLCSEEWYAGIPFRRGYLLHGVPGSGKTSLIHSLAGELGLDIYVISLSAKGMSDNMLATLMGNIPSRCILLLEDLDAAFTRGVSRDDTSTGAPSTSTSTSSSTSTAKTKDDSNDGSTLTLSGLLNSLDGVAAAEGRLLFATTNHIERLDPALSRPGRMDVWVNFKHASKWQAEGIFKCFFPAKPSSDGAASPTAPTSAKPGDETPFAEGLAEPKRKKAAHSAPVLSEEEISSLAERFADAIPEDELSVAALQGYLLRNKTRPRECVDEVAAWVVQERETRAKLKKEKEEREAKEKKEAEEAEEKAKKDAEEKAKKEAEEKAKEVEEKTKEGAVSTSEFSAASETSADANQGTFSVESGGETASDQECTKPGTDADLETSVISDDEASQSSDAQSQDVKEKWVAVKAHSPDPGV
ncbi:P-loop containing nucleoside triphosphate hydrolase protein [Daedalea quercina L-15889]|uniref:p-loop containing nucleoside triphosphate hydrolase protein n=1 Tax=Daedalea quercina L-15889 TaxID=1314783 RepID=A0A165PVB5_9APHY|nr:P-loop containing nucleoside triphosphate hydrolase protein [Daedalea quercina L-15889]